LAVGPRGDNARYQGPDWGQPTPPAMSTPDHFRIEEEQQCRCASPIGNIASDCKAHCVVGASADNAATRGHVLPPIEYDHPPIGDWVVQRGDTERMQKECPKTSLPLTLASVFRAAAAKEGQPALYCRILIADDSILKMPRGIS
jgi:hypothetical protein